MAMRDWNKNGKDDAFDMLTDYYLYKQTFGKDENDEKKAHSAPVSCSRSASPSSNTEQEDFFGLSEIGEKNTEDILRLLMKRKKMMDYYFETCSIESGFREVMDNRQMGKDFWLFDFAKQLDFCTLQRPQKIKLLQLLLDAFSVNNPMTAEEYYKVMNENDDYYRYMIHCFSVDTKDSAVFWRIWGAMSGNDSERIDMMMEYTKAHTKFMIQLEEYLRRMFPGRGFGGHMQKYITKLVNYIANAMSDGSDAASNANYLVNPIFPCDLK